MFDYSKPHRCIFCDKIIINNKNMIRIYPDKCFHIICDRKLRENRLPIDLNKYNKV
jgi:hypothetical protein